MRPHIALSNSKLVIWNVWKTIKLGTGLTRVDDFRIALKQANCRVSTLGNDILGKLAITDAPEDGTTINLVAVSVTELGFADGGTYKDICARAIEIGLELTPNEIGPQLRLQYPAQPSGEYLLIAMEPIIDSNGDDRIFAVNHDAGELLLYAFYGHPDNFWDGSQRFVFVSRR